ncbi:MAG: hypothetical protein J6K84_03035 [Oscillospiraceae bacterium]|nr:hypothetical protein [Oscillospiraceae bacterium]
MFGTVLADKSLLSEESLSRYQASYCGLCRTLKAEYGSIARLVLSYDMTFLVLLLGSLYEPEEQKGCKWCAMHPTKKHEYFSSSVSSYAAAMNVALAYYKCLDDWQDERNILRLMQAWALKKSANKVKKAYPRQCATMEKELKNLTELERSQVENADLAAAFFGNLTGEFFCQNPNDHWAEHLRRIGQQLGKFIYLYDAFLDLEQDIKKNHYNPLKGHVDLSHKDDFLPVLHGILGDLMKDLEFLPLVQDVDILRNILYSGIWLPYTSKKKQQKEG